MTGRLRPELWERFRGGLLAVREAVWAWGRRLPEEERAALRAVADHPAFTGLGPAIESLERGRWITARTVEAVTRLRDELPPAARTAAGQPADKAVLLWAHALQAGERPDGLAYAFPDLLPGRVEVASPAAVVLRVRSVMWLGGNRPLRGSEEGIERVYHAVSAALHATGDGAPCLEDVTFDYEWDRLTGGPQREPRQLMELLTLLASEPLPFELLGAGWEALPSPLRLAVRDRAAMVELANGLAARALVAAGEDALVCSEATQDQSLRRLDPAEERRACAVAVRFLRAALPSDTHHSASWGAWGPAVAHVEAAVQHAQRLEVRMEDAAHLLDRLAVYRRQAEQDFDAAIRTSERAIALADRAGQPDPEEYGIYLGNQAMALRAARRLPEAVAVMDRSLEVTRSSLGTEHEEYAGSLSIKGNILEAWKRYDDAAMAHAEALAIIRRVAAQRPEPAVIGTMVEILNDYAIYLLRDEPNRSDDALALALLDEALRHVERGDYGWRQVTMNRARALQRMGRHREAEPVLRDLVRYCEEAYGDPSYELSVALRDLADILGELGSPEYDEVYLRAHEVDDALGPDA
jgi:tetratricopeptide (TPR) repeat protein